MQGREETPSVLSKLQKWGDYASVGSPVEPTLLIPMKTPLSQKILGSWTLPEQPKHALSVASLLDQQRKLGRDVGMILDLSNHASLYAEDLVPGVQYERVSLVAKAFPQPEAVERVVEVASDFWRLHPDKHIAIHCAYGYNRTGFVVCSYLVQALGFSVDAALELFRKARPPGVRHEDFQAELRRRYGHAGGMASRNSISSMHSDLASVADFLGQRPSLPYAASTASSMPDTYYSAREGGPGSSNSLDLRRGSGEESPSAHLSRLHYSPERLSRRPHTSAERRQPAESNGHRDSHTTPSLTSAPALNNDSLGLSQRQILDSFLASSMTAGTEANADPSREPCPPQRLDFEQGVRTDLPAVSTPRAQVQGQGSSQASSSGYASSPFSRHCHSSCPKEVLEARGVPSNGGLGTPPSTCREQFPAQQAQGPHGSAMASAGPAAAEEQRETRARPLCALM